ncbi:glucose-1-phosphate adenylyltransferase [Elusimicrobiota bacterium]
MNLDRTMTVLLAGGKGQRLGPLTRDRAKPAVPFGGIYRIVDFTLSNCVNSGLCRVVVLVQYRSRSLNRHIRDGWSVLVNPGRGEFIEALPPQQHVGDRWYMGTANAVHQNFFTIRDEKPDNVLVLSGDHIYKMDYRDLLESHEETGADVTVGAVDINKKEAFAFGVIDAGEDGQIARFIEKPKDPALIPGEGDRCLASMGIYVFKTEVLARLLNEDAEDVNSSHDFGKDVLPKLAGTGSIHAFRFIDKNKKESQYWRDVGTIDSYYEANMDLVKVDPLLNLYDGVWPVYTCKISAPPPKFVFADQEAGRMGIAVDSIVSPGCIVSGGLVRWSLLSPLVRIHSYSRVEDSILFENVDVGRHAKIRRAIIDKDVRIPPGTEIGYDLERDRKRFLVTESGLVVISKRTIL